jgi:hypothetical protein
MNNPMKKKLLFLTKNRNKVRDLASYFSDNGYAPVIIEQDACVQEGKLVVEEKTVFYDDIDILAETRAAFILDSGYMWPQPVLKPTETEWKAYQHNLDEYLRNEREASSLWYSLVQIVNEAVPLCINPQAAFEASVFKPWAFEVLNDAGVPLAPYIVSNDSRQINGFLDAHEGFFLSLPLAGDGGVRWMDRKDIENHDLKNMPLFLQALSCKDEITLIAIQGKIVYGRPPPGVDAAAPVDRTTVLQEVLTMPFAEITLRYGEGGTVISDFSPSPGILSLDDASREKVFKGLLLLIGEAWR